MILTTTVRRLAGTAVAVALATAGLGLTAGSASAAPSARSYESQFVGSINAARHAQHRAPLATNAHLDAVARGWARRMADANTLEHNPHLTSDVGGWLVVGENVGVGGDERGLHSAFMHSPGHRANILSRSYTQVGIGVVFAHGRTWVVEDFRKPRPTASTAHTSSRYLHYGSTGSKVRHLQKILHVHATGYFGPVTRATLKKWQSHHGVRPTGTLNKPTRTKMHF